VEGAGALPTPIRGPRAFLNLTILTRSDAPLKRNGGSQRTFSCSTCDEHATRAVLRRRLRTAKIVAPCSSVTTAEALQARARWI